VVRSGLTLKNKESGLIWLKSNPLRQLHESINKRKGSLILIKLEHIEYLQVIEVTKGFQMQTPVLSSGLLDLLFKDLQISELD
jgi:hypothetical protein